MWLTPQQYNELRFYLNAELEKAETAYGEILKRYVEPGTQQYNELRFYLNAELEKAEKAYGEILKRYVEPGTNPNPPNPNPPNPEPGPPGTLINLQWGNPPTDTRGTSASIGNMSTTTVVGRLAVPLGVTSPRGQPGVISVVEYDGPPVERVLSLSVQPNDFRGYRAGLSGKPPSDPTGATCPIDWAIGINPNMLFQLTGATGTAPKVTPGQTYYLNLRTMFYSSGAPSCSASSCNVRFTVNPPR